MAHVLASTCITHLLKVEQQPVLSVWVKQAIIDKQLTSFNRLVLWHCDNIKGMSLTLDC